ncbi:MAG: benzoyl-CoA 2,3-epoxidase subunit BoxB [Planctomycetota bacterium]|nr:MAG: benzoyl-CoA 2,3-epoxidase subunit BoxB [Planctomycetota bacterium]
MSDKIPNNVDLSSNRKLQKALERWLPNYLDWWREMGPEGFQEDWIYLRTAVSVDTDGWAHFDYVKMPDYRWGIFLTPPEKERTIAFGDEIGKRVWDEVPGEVRKELRRLIVVQADTEPASVEQQRLLGKTCPSLYDLRNLFQVNVEEGRHLWAMVYLLMQYFGRDGREEAEDLLVRRSGHQDSPRMLEAFNKPIQDWLSFFCFTTFTDRDGKFQLGALAESAFDPLARSTRFMLTEEAHHMFVGETGVGRVIQRTVELMKTAPEGDVTKVGGIPLDMIQRYMNEWLTASMDLFGSEDSSNSATFFAAGLKGRWEESKPGRYEDHKCLEGEYTLEVPRDEGGFAERRIPLRRAMNLVLRDSYVEDCDRVFARWNRILEKAGMSERFYRASDRFNRNQGVYAGMPFDPWGKLLSREEWEAKKSEWLPTEADREYLRRIMTPVTEPGVYANWIAPPKKGINGKPIDFAYVKFARDEN